MVALPLLAERVRAVACAAGREIVAWWHNSCGELPGRERERELLRAASYLGSPCELCGERSLHGELLL